MNAPGKSTLLQVDGFVHPSKQHHHQLAAAAAGAPQPGRRYVPQMESVDWELPGECGQRGDDGPLWRYETLLRIPRPRTTGVREAGGGLILWPLRDARINGETLRGQRKRAYARRLLAQGAAVIAAR